MIRGFCLLLSAVLQIVLLNPGAVVAVALVEDLAWYLFEELFFY